MQDVLVCRPLSAESLCQAKELLPDRSTLVCVAKYVLTSIPDPKSTKITFSIAFPCIILEVIYALDEA